MADQTTYSKEGWDALGRAARAYNSCAANGDPELIGLARDLFHFVLRRVNRDCVVRYGAGESAGRKEV